MKSINLSIIIVNYNTPELVYNCIKSIKEHAALSYEIIVVDNGSKEELRIQNSELNKLQTANCKLLTLEKNLGFGTGNNVGAKKATGEYLLLLNSDALVVDDSIDKMHQFMAGHDEVGALTCLLYNDIKCTKMQKYFYGNFQSLGSLTIRRYNYQKINLSQEFFYTDIVTGACFLIKRKFYEELGGFDEKIFMYLEDDDLCKRIIDKGYQNAVLNTAKIAHLEGKSVKNNSQRKKLYYDSQTYFWNKHYGFWATLIMRIVRWPIKILKTNK